MKTQEDALSERTFCSTKDIFWVAKFYIIFLDNPNVGKDFGNVRKKTANEDRIQLVRARWHWREEKSPRNSRCRESTTDLRLRIALMTNIGEDKVFQKRPIFTSSVIWRQVHENTTVTSS